MPILPILGGLGHPPIWEKTWIYGYQKSCLDLYITYMEEKNKILVILNEKIAFKIFPDFITVGL